MADLPRVGASLALLRARVARRLRSAIPFDVFRSGARQAVRDAAAWPQPASAPLPFRQPATPPANYRPSVEVMDTVARQLGARDHLEWIACAPAWAQAHFRLTCWLLDLARLSVGKLS